MKNKIRLYYFLIGVLVALFVSICACFAVISTGYVDTRRLVIYSGIAEKAYDGTPLTSESFGIRHGKLKDGHSLIVETYGSQTEKGASFNYFHYTIVDQAGNSVTNEYRIIETPGLLIVHEEGWIDWDKLDKEKIEDLIDRFGNYDFSSLDLENMNIEDLLKQLENSNLTEEQREQLMQAIAAKVMASMMANQNLDTDGDGIPNYQDNDVNGNGTPNGQDADVDGDGLPNGQDDDVDGDGMPNDIDNDIDGDGILNENDDDPNGASVGVGQGGLGGAGNQRFDNNLQQQGNGFGDNADVEVLSLISYSNVASEYYLRYENFGDYNGSGFDYAQEYDQSVVSPLYFTGTALNNAGRVMDQIVIENLDGSNAYYLPYYSITGGIKETGDIRFSQSLPIYMTKASNYDYLAEGQTYLVPSDLTSQEGRYRNFVYNNYLNIDEWLKNELLDLTGYFWGDKLSIARQIRDYVQNCAGYNLEFDTFPAGEDMVLYFLKEGKEGICQHFAAAATMIFRAYGIPARYTCGYKVTAEPYNVTVVTGKYAHAWVEIYVDGMGWVEVEVTGGAFDEVRKNELVLKTPSVSKVYDGIPIDYSEAIKWEYDGYLKSGHYIEVVGGEDIQMPVNACAPYQNNGFEYVIRDEFGNDITEEYEIKRVEYGTLQISKRPITIWASGNVDSPYYEKEIKLPYTGELQKSENYDFEGINDEESRGLLNDHSVELLTTTEAKDIGVHKNIQTYRIVDWTNYREDVTNNYEIDAKEGAFEIVKIKLCVNTDNYNHQYDANYAIRQDNKESWQRYWFDTGLDQDDMPYGKVLDGHKVQKGEFEGEFNPTNVGETTENEFKIIIFENGIDVTDKYYEIKYEYGTAKVEPRDIVIYRKDAEKEFVAFAKLYSYDFELQDENDLLDGHKVELAKSFSVSTCGRHKNECEFGIVDSNGDTVTQNYNIKYQTKKGYNGELFLYKSIKVTAENISKVYDGTPLVYDKGYTPVGTTLYGHTIDVQFNNITDVGTKKSVSVKVVDTSGNDVTKDYYKVTVVGNLKITQKELTVKTKDVKYSYDGITTFNGEMEDLVVSGLVAGHDISDELVFTGKISYYGECPNSFERNTLKILDASGKDVTKNYHIEIAFGTITVDV